MRGMSSASAPGCAVFCPGRKTRRVALGCSGKAGPRTLEPIIEHAFPARDQQPGGRERGRRGDPELALSLIHI